MGLMDIRVQEHLKDSQFLSLELNICCSLIISDQDSSKHKRKFPHLVSCGSFSDPRRIPGYLRLPTRQCMARVWIKYASLMFLDPLRIHMSPYKSSILTIRICYFYNSQNESWMKNVMGHFWPNALH